MTFELQVVIATTLILFVLLMFQGGLVPINHGLKWGLGSRDEARKPSALQSRTGRTIANHVEGMLLFVPLALVAEQMQLATALTAIGAGLYLGGRIGFTAFYLIGVPYMRSAAWAVSLLGILIFAIPVIGAAI